MAKKGYREGVSRKEWSALSHITKSTRRVVVISFLLFQQQRFIEDVGKNNFISGIGPSIRFRLSRKLWKVKKYNP